MPPPLDGESRTIVEHLGLDADQIAKLEQKQLFEMSEEEVGVYIRYAHAKYPDLRERIVHLGRKNIGQPYKLYLLGEFPFETHDPLPLYSLTHSDCVVFSEHTYAMALTRDWPSFFTMLQRIRYIDGQIGVVTRNHYTEADWNRNNNWLVEDITAEIGGDNALAFTQTVRRERFFRNRYNLEVSIPDETVNDVYIPTEHVPAILDQLQPGDFVNVMRGPDNKGVYAGHVGLITHGEDGTVNFLHSTTPTVIEEPLMTYVAKHHARDARRDPGSAVLQGFKFLRLRENPVENLRAIDGDEAPRISPPKESRLTAQP
ncbi:MAG: DUF1460 domain-containing protein [Candidatus Sumerlaeia bacterium]|nr:DUF1460 domain-containing protein [Candidatus Sumerlaeia bacterium]